jgi:hypothetical protein
MTGHAEMDDQGAVIEADQQVLATPTRDANRSSAQKFRQVDRERPAQAGMAKSNSFDYTSFKMRRDTAPRDFNFR